MNYLSISEKQAKWYMSCAYSKKSPLIGTGAVRTGKTEIGIYGLATRIKYNLDNSINVSREHTYGILAFTFKLAKNNVGLILVEALKEEGVLVELKGSSIVPSNKSKYKDTGLRIDLFGASNESSYRSFQGMTFRGVYIDEGALMPPSALKVAIDRVMTFDRINESIVIITSNPEGNEDHHFYQTYVKGNVDHFHFKLVDNPLFDEEYVNKMKLKMPEQAFRRSILGEWVSSVGAIYLNQPKVKKIKNQKIKYDYVTFGVDEGRIDATVCTMTCFYKDTKTYFVEDIYRHKNGDIQKTMIQVLNEMREWLNEKAKQKRLEDVPLYLECETNPGFIYDSFKNDLTLDPKFIVDKVNKKKRDHKSSSAIQERIDVTNMLIEMGTLVIDENCIELRKAFSNAMYDKKGIRLDNGTSDIDSLDSFEYTILEDIKEIKEDYYDKFLGLEIKNEKRI